MADAPQAAEKQQAAAERDEAKDGDATNEAERRRRAEKRKKRREKDKEKRRGGGGGGEDKQDEAAALARLGADADLSPEALERFKSPAIARFFAGNGGPLRLAFDAVRGRHLRASRRAARGDELLSERPYAGVVYDSEAETRCHLCFGTARVYLLCGACKFVRYCSSRCKQADEIVHGLECSAVARRGELGLEAGEDSAPWRLIIRLLCTAWRERYERTKAEQAEGQRAKLQALLRQRQAAGKSKLEFEDVMDLASHEQSVSREARAAGAQVLLALQRIVDSDAWPGLPAATLLLFRVQCNAQTVRDDNRQRIGLALYPAVAYLNHSCEPNATISFSDSATCSVRALRDIQEGEEVTVTYIDLYQVKAERRAALRSANFVAHCNCALCARPIGVTADRFIGGFVCQSCGKGLVNFWDHPEEAKWPCVECKAANDAAALRNAEATIREAFGRALAHMSQRTMGATQQALSVLESDVFGSEAARRLHPHHSLLFNAHLMRAAACLATGDGRGVVAASDAALAAMRACLRDVHMEVGLVLSKRATGSQLVAAAARARAEQQGAEASRELIAEAAAASATAAESWASALRVLSDTMGPEHSLTREAARAARRGKGKEKEKEKGKGSEQE